MARGIEKFEGRGLVDTQTIPMPSDNGAAWGQAAKLFSGISAAIGELADKAAAREGENAGLQAGLDASTPAAYVPPAAAAAGKSATPGRPHQVSDPADTSMPAYKRALLNAIAGGESGGAYNVRYTPAGGASFDDLSHHPNIAEKAGDSTSNAAGRYQFLKSTWDGLGGGDFSPKNQDRRAWQLATRDYRSRTGRDLDADLQQGGLTPAIVGALSPTWEAFKKSGSRAPIATYNATLARLGSGAAAPAAGSALAAAGAAAPAPAPISTPSTPLQLRRDGSIFGDAADAAAMKTFAWKLDAGIRTDVAAATDAAGDDPHKLEASLADIRKRYEGDATLGGDVRLKALFEQNFTQQTAIARLHVGAKQQQLLEQEKAVAADNSVEATALSLERQGHEIGSNPQGDAVLFDLLGKANNSIDAASADGAMSPAERENAKRKLALRVIGARVAGTFDALPDPEAQTKFAEGLVTEWASGKSPLSQLPLDTVQTLSQQLASAAATNRREGRAKGAGERAQFKQALTDDVTSMAATGQGVPFGGKPLDRDTVAKTMGEATAVAWEADRRTAAATYSATADLATMTPEAMATRLAVLTPKPGEAGYADKLALHDQVAKAASAELKRRADDPAAAVDEHFPTVKAALKNWDVTKPETVGAVMRERLGAQAALGIAPEDQRPLNGLQARQISRAMRASPDAAEGYATLFTKALGPDAPKALAQLGDEAPGLATAAGQVAAGGDPKGLRFLIAQGLRESRPGYKAPAREPAAEATAMQENYGSAYGLVPDTDGAIRGNAGRIFLALTAERGIVPSVKDPEGRKAFDEAAQLAAGARFSAGVQFGGVTDVNGVRTAVPTGMRAGAVEPLVNSITAEDLAKLPPIGSASGFAVKPDQIAGGRLVAVGDGLYRVALGTGADPRYVMGTDGKFWTLDLRALERNKPTPVTDFSLGAPL